MLYIYKMYHTTSIRDDKDDCPVLQMSNSIILNINKIEDGDIVEKVYAKHLKGDNLNGLNGSVYFFSKGFDILGSQYYIKIKGKD